MHLCAVLMADLFLWQTVAMSFPLNGAAWHPGDWLNEESDTGVVSWREAAHFDVELQWDLRGGTVATDCDPGSLILSYTLNPALTDRLVFWMSQQLCVGTICNCELDMTVLPNVMGVCVCVFSQFHLSVHRKQQGLCQGVEPPLRADLQRAFNVQLHTSLRTNSRVGQDAEILSGRPMLTNTHARAHMHTQQHTK